MKSEYKTEESGRRIVFVRNKRYYYRELFGELRPVKSTHLGQRLAIEICIESSGRGDATQAQISVWDGSLSGWRPVYNLHPEEMSIYAALESQHGRNLMTNISADPKEIQGFLMVAFEADVKSLKDAAAFILQITI
jgi:hypothetical protein